MKRYWLCRCGTRNERTKQKCGGDGCKRSRPKAQRPPHEKALENSYEAFRDFNQRVHGPAFGPDWDPDDCGVCGKKPVDITVRKHDRDHGHRKTENSYGKMRGLACPGDSGCNALMKGLTAVRARQIADYMARAELENAA